MKKVVFFSLTLITIITTFYINKNNRKDIISELVDNNMLAFTVDGENTTTMPTKGSGFKVKSITCKNNSNVVWDNDNWEIEVIKLESEDTCVIDFTSETNFEYAYTGNVQTFIAPTSGEYTLEVWGAQGGTASTTYIGGYGGYSTGTVLLNKGDKLYIYVGNQPTSSEGGYNGGGTVGTYGHGGGGATHIAKSEGLLSTMSSKISDILIVAGGGGGSVDYGSEAPSGSGGHAGGYIGGNGYYGTWSTNPGKGGTQTAGGTYGLCSDGVACGNEGSFGQGGSLLSCSHYSCDVNYQTGGGGGFYGGGSARHTGGGGGSGYISSSLLSNKSMYCYNCEESSQTDTKTIKTTTYSETPISNSAKLGNGYAKITKNVEDINTVRIITNTPEGIDSTNKSTINNGKIYFYSNYPILNVEGCDAEIKDNKLIINNVSGNVTCTITQKEPIYLLSQLLSDKSTRLTRTIFTNSFTDTNSKTLYTTTENNNTYYYFSGNALDNWVKFAGYYWRIIRTNEDGSIRLLYHGTSTTSTEAYIATSAFNSSSDNPMYVGYMYGPSGSLESNRTNTTDSTVKKVLDNWYKTNLINYSKYISETAIYCNDRSIGSGTYSIVSDGSSLLFSPYQRLQYDDPPTYLCSDISDSFSVSSSTGNGKLTYPIGLMTADEANYAGGIKYSTSVNAYTYYYYNSNSESSVGANYWWTMSPAMWSSSIVDTYQIGGSNISGRYDVVNVAAQRVVRPVISIKGTNAWKSGDGSADNPYEIVTD